MQPVKLTFSTIQANAPHVRVTVPERFHHFYDSLVRTASERADSGHCVKRGFINIYRSGVFHTVGKPRAYDRHAGDIYATMQDAVAAIDPPSHYVDTIPIEWVDTEDCQPNGGELS